MSVKRRMAEMSWREVRAALASQPVVLIPLGSTEQHGPVAPTGDYLIADEIAVRVAERTNSLVAPVIPYSLALNDARFWRGYYATGDDFFQSAKETFDTLYEEGETTPKMMSMGLHCRMAGVPGRASGLDRFIAYAKNHPDVWFAGRSDIARWWLQHQKG